MVEDEALREQIAELKRRLLDGGSESDWTRANSLQNLSLDIVRSFLAGKMSAAQLVLIVKRLGEEEQQQSTQQPGSSSAEPQLLVKNIMSAIWILATQVIEP